MNDLLISIKDWFKDRVSNPFYSVFIFSVIVHNWKFFYIFFGPNNVDLLDLKLEYLENGEVKIFCTLISFVLIPFLYTAFIISVTPFFAYYAQIVRDWHMNRLRITHKHSESEYEESVSQIIEEIAKEKQKQSGAKNTINDNMSEYEKWDEEIYSNKDKNLVLALQTLKNIIYKTNKRYTIVQGVENPSERTYIGPDHLLLLDINDLVTIDNFKYELELTKKGKYFLKKIVR
jgi:hypothetical protein